MNINCITDSVMSANTVLKQCVQSQEPKTKTKSEQMADNKPFVAEIVWRNIFLMLFLHLMGIYGFIHLAFFAKIGTIVFFYLLLMMSSIGVQAGAHRLWSHRSYKAKFRLRVMLAIFHILAFQNDIYEWCRDHRVHHKFAETDADPHNAKRGFFFSHVGWLLVKKHPEVRIKGKNVDMSDLLTDPVVRFQQKYYKSLLVLIYFTLPTLIPRLLWSESLWTSFLVCVMARHCLTLNITWCVNSAAHIWGSRPYDTHIDAREASIRHFLMGEGFHNYHHTFPWDYSASELGAIDVFNPATAAIDLFAHLGWAYDLKSVPKNIVDKRRIRSGDPNEVGPQCSVNKMRRSLYEWVGGLTVLFIPLIIILIARTFFHVFRSYLQIFPNSIIDL